MIGIKNQERNERCNVIYSKICTQWITIKKLQICKSCALGDCQIIFCRRCQGVCWRSDSENSTDSQAATWTVQHKVDNTDGDDTSNTGENDADDATQLQQLATKTTSAQSRADNIDAVVNHTV